jgi:hypothetical protein
MNKKNRIPQVSSGINTIQSLLAKEEIVLWFFGVISEDMVLVDLLKLVFDTLVDDINHEIIK